MQSFLKMWEQKLYKVKLIYLAQTKKKNREVQMSYYKNIILLNAFLIVLGFMRHHLILREKFMGNLKLYPKNI